MNPHLVLDAGAEDVVGFAQRAVGIDPDLGDDKKADAFGPRRAPSIRARTRWMMFSVRLWSPQVIKRLLPSIL